MTRNNGSVRCLLDLKKLNRRNKENDMTIKEIILGLNDLKIDAESHREKAGVRKF